MWSWRVAVAGSMASKQMAAPAVRVAGGYGLTKFLRLSVVSIMEVSEFNRVFSG